MFEFQFLIGTVKTIYGKGYIDYKLYEFQFLIGTVKTREGALENDTDKVDVSIPHRYCKNVYI